MKILHEIYNEPQPKMVVDLALPKKTRLLGARREAKASTDKILLLDLLEFRKKVYMLDSMVKISQLLYNGIH
jgi:hypothetical protein